MLRGVTSSAVGALLLAHVGAAEAQIRERARSTIAIRASVAPRFEIVRDKDGVRIVASHAPPAYRVTIVDEPAAVPTGTGLDSSRNATRARVLLIAPD